MIKKLLIFFSVLLFVVLYFPVALPSGQPRISYSTIPDADADFLISRNIARGDGWYSSFSILYPPGRFLLQAFFYNVLSPSFTVNAIIRVLSSSVLFPAAFFLLSFYFLEKMFRRFFIAYFFALCTSALYLMFIRSAQEVHVIAALFFIFFIKGKLSKFLLGILGALFGLVFLFRLDAGVILLLSLCCTIPYNLSQIKKWSANIYFFVFGICTIWIPVLTAIILKGSLFNFLYDIFILGLVIQPKFMSLPIPQNEFGLVWLSSLIFLCSASGAIILDSKKFSDIKTRVSVQSFAMFMTLSYVATLGRSDEPHLWYGLTWIPLLIIYAAVRTLYVLFRRERVHFRQIFLFSPLLLGYGWTILHWKSPTLFLITAALLGIVLRKMRLSSVSLLIAGSITALLVFHSVSYLSLRYTLPLPPLNKVFSYDWVKSEEPEVGGVLLDEKSELVIRKIRADIPQTETYLFIFPKNLLLHEYLHLSNPTRYIILANERSDWTEQEIIDQLKKTNTAYFLVFPESAELREGPVWDWMLQHTIVASQYDFGEEKAELRILPSEISCELPE